MWSMQRQILVHALQVRVTQQMHSREKSILGDYKVDVKFPRNEQKLQLSSVQTCYCFYF